VSRISIEHVAAALRKVQSMDPPQKATLIDEIHVKQPNLLASCVVQARLGADEHSVEFLLDLLLVCYLAMNDSGYEWPLITDDEQERQLARMVGAIQFSEDLADPVTADAARSNTSPTTLSSRCSRWLSVNVQNGSTTSRTAMPRRNPTSS